MTTTILKNCIEVAKATENKYMENQLTKVLDELNNNAKQVLKDAGYYVDNLWHIEDVKAYHECADYKAQQILNKALTNEWLMGQINELIENEYNN